MKKPILSVITILLVLALSSLAVTAEGMPRKPGFYDLEVSGKYSSFVSLKALTLEEDPIEGKDLSIGDKETTFYREAAKIQFKYGWAEKGRQYLITVQKGTDSVPSLDSLVYLDQQTADSGSITFVLYPGELEDRAQYGIYVSGSSAEGFTPQKLAASFRYYDGTPEASEMEESLIFEEIQRALKTGVQVLAAE